MILAFVSDTLKQIGLYPNYVVSLSDVVAHFGKPDRVSVEPHFAELFPPDQCDLVLAWVHRGLSVWSNDVPINGACKMVKQGNGLGPNLPASGISFVLPADMSPWESGRDYPWTGFTTP